MAKRRSLRSSVTYPTITLRRASESMHHEHIGEDISIFAIIAFMVSLLVIVPAMFILLIDALGLPETHPLSIIAFPVVALASAPEYPLLAVSQFFGFPVVLPLIALTLATISLARNELNKPMAAVSILFVVFSIAAYLFVRFVLGVF